MSELKSLIDTYSGIIDELSVNDVLTEKETLFLGSIEFLIQDQEKKIFYLFQLLDDIDTASDMFREDHEGFRRFVRKMHEKRFEIVDDAESKRLYASYYERRDKDEHYKDEVKG